MTELEVAMSVDDARRITERLRLKVSHISEQLDGLRELIRQARDGRVWEVLGHTSWTAYVADVVGDQPMRLARDQRRELVTVLADEGMSTRAISMVVGVSQPTVVSDYRSGDQNLSPVAIDRVTGEILLEPADVALVAEVLVAQEKTVSGLDGKTYPRPTLSPPRRKPITDDIDRCVFDLDRRVEILYRLMADKRWAINRAAIAERALGPIKMSAALLTQIAADLETPTCKDNQ
jgi:hypothetical protein